MNHASLGPLGGGAQQSLYLVHRLVSEHDVGRGRHTAVVDRTAGLVLPELLQSKRLLIGSR
eukprot:SAG25_NODE_12262_length_283_cov_2.217391_1_plen_60_part_10